MLKFYSTSAYKKWLLTAPMPIQKWLQKEKVLLLKKIKPGSNILDIGCGFGRHIKLLAPKAVIIFGVDNNQKMVALAKNNLLKYKNAKILNRDAIDLNLPNNYFDYIICMANTFGNFLDKKFTILKEMRKVLKNDGVIYISVYSGKASKIREESYKKAGLHIINNVEGVIKTTDGLVSEQFSKAKLADFFKKAGFKYRIVKLTSLSYFCTLSK